MGKECQAQALMELSLGVSEREDRCEAHLTYKGEVAEKNVDKVEVFNKYFSRSTCNLLRRQQCNWCAEGRNRPLAC